MNKNRTSKETIFVILDLTCLLASYIFAYFFRHKNFNFYDFTIYRDMFFVIISINIILCFFYEPYKNILYRDYLDELKTSIIFDSLSLFFSVLYLFIVKNSGDYSRITLGLTYFLYFCSSYLFRILYKKLLRRKSVTSLSNGKKSLLILCNKNDAKSIIKCISKNNFDNYCISGLCIADYDLENDTIHNFKVVTNINNVLKYISSNWVDDILIAMDYKKVPINVIEGFKQSGISIHIKLNEIELMSDKIQYIDKIGEIDVITAVNKTYSNYQLFVKRLMDIVGGIIGCLISILLILVIGPIIYINSPGNIIYESKRVGKNGKIFKFYKFRSMVLNADDLKEDLMKDNKVKDGMMFKIENDPRIIPGIGSFIRKTSLDEFPQFFNVLKGDMSLVGTRPPTVDEWNKYSPYYRSRLIIKPGITGLWQVSGRSNIIDFNEVVKLDNEYINNWTISLDIKILFRTILNLFKKDNNGAM